MKVDELVKPLEAIVGSKYVSVTDMDREIYRRILLISEFTPERPDIVVLPGSTEEISKI